MKCYEIQFFIFIYLTQIIYSFVQNNNSFSNLLPLTYNKTTNSFYLTTSFHTNNKSDYFNITFRLNITSSLSYILNNNELISSLDYIKCDDDSCMLVDFNTEHCENNITNFCINNDINDIFYTETKFAFTTANDNFKMVLGVYNKNNNNSESFNEYGQIGLNAAYTSFIPVYVHLNKLNRSKNIFSFCYSNKLNQGYVNFFDDNIYINNNITFEITANDNYALYFHKIQLHNQNDYDINMIIVNNKEKSDSLGVLSFDTNKLLLPKDMFNNLLQKTLMFVGIRVKHDEVTIQENTDGSIYFIIKEECTNSLNMLFPLIKFYLGSYAERTASNPKIIEYNWYPEDYLEYKNNNNSLNKKEYQFLVGKNIDDEVVFGSSLFNRKEIALNLNKKIFSYCESDCNILKEKNKLIPIIPCDLDELKFYVKMLKIFMISLGIIALILFIALLNLIYRKRFMCIRQVYNESNIEMRFLFD